MQSLEEAAHIAYQNELRAAERHMEQSEGPESGKCCDCLHFCEAAFSEHVPTAVTYMLNHCGFCTYEEDYPTIVDRSEEHSREDCFAPWEVDK